MNVHPALLFLNLSRMLFQSLTAGRTDYRKASKKPATFGIEVFYDRISRQIIFKPSKVAAPRKKDLTHSFLPITALRSRPFLVLSFLYFNWIVPCSEL